jgi:hypothetical protein
MALLLIAVLAACDPTHAIARGRAKQVSAPSPALPVIVCEPFGDAREYPAFVTVHSPTCKEKFIRTEEIAGVRPASTVVGAPLGAKAELFFHDTRFLFVAEEPEKVAEAIGGLVLFHGPKNPVWLNPHEIGGVQDPIRGILEEVHLNGSKKRARSVPGAVGENSNQGAKAEIFMHDTRSIYVIESPRAITAILSAALQEK